MTYYGQTNPKWSGKFLGFNDSLPYTIGNFGCAITAVANLMTINGDDTTPDVVNNQFKLNGGFAAIEQDDGTTSTKGSGIMIWSAIPKLNPAIIPSGVVGTVAATNTWLEDGPNYAIIEYRLSNGGQHFCLGNLVNTIIDSEDGHQKNILTYKFVQAHLYRWAEPGKGQATEIPVAPPLTPQEGIMVEDLDDQYEFFTKLGYHERGRAMTRDEFRQSFVGQTWLAAMHTLADDPEADTAQHAQDVGKQAIAEDWQGQIATFKAATVVPPTITFTAQTPLPMTSTVTPGTTTFTVSYANTEVVNKVTRIAKADGEMVDFGGDITGGEKLPTLPFKSGTIFHQFSTFTVGNISYVRTQKSKDNKQWYGTPENLFDPLPKPELTGADAANLNLSKLFGKIGHWVYSLFIKHN